MPIVQDISTYSYKILLRAFNRPGTKQVPDGYIQKQINIAINTTLQGNPKLLCDFLGKINSDPNIPIKEKTELIVRSLSKLLHYFLENETEKSLWHIIQTPVFATEPIEKIVPPKSIKLKFTGRTPNEVVIFEEREGNVLKGWGRGNMTEGICVDIPRNYLFDTSPQSGEPSRIFKRFAHYSLLIVPRSIVNYEQFYALNDATHLPKLPESKEKLVNFTNELMFTLDQEGNPIFVLDKSNPNSLVIAHIGDTYFYELKIWTNGPDRGKKILTSLSARLENF